MQPRSNYDYSEAETTSCISKVQPLNLDGEWCQAETEAIPASVEHLCLLADTVPVVLWMSDASSRYTFLNQNCLKLFDRSLGEELETAWIKSVHPEDLQQCQQAYHLAIETRSHFNCEYRIRCRNGQYCWILDTAVPLQTADGNFAGYAGTSLDISERKQLEEQLKKSRNRVTEMVAERTAELICSNSQLEKAVTQTQQARELDREISQQFRAIFEQAAVGITNINPQGEFIRVNQRFCQIVGYNESELMQMTFRQITHPDDLLANEYYREACLTNQTQSYSLEKRYIRKDGSPVWVNLTVSIVRDSMLHPKYTIAIIEDISNRKKAEFALRQSQQMLQLVMDNIPQAICWKDKNSIYLGCNRTAATDAGLAACQDIIGLTDWDLPCTKEQANSFRKGDAEVMITDTPQYHILQRQLQANGQLAWLDTNKIPLHDTEGNVVGILVTYEDITPHKQAQEEIIESAQRLSTVIETVGEGITLSDAEGNFIIYNSKMQEMTGYSKEEAETSGDFLRLLYPDAQAHAIALNGIREMLQGGEFQDVETTIATKEGKQKTLLVSTSLMQYKNRTLFLSAYRDISHRVEAQEAQRQAEEKYRSLFENALEGIFQTTFDGQYLNANPALAKIYGYSTPQELIARLTNIERQLYVEPNRRAEFSRLLQENDIVACFESQVYRSDGSIIWISENARAVRDRHGTLLYYEGTVEDITERKHLEEERRQQAEQERLMSKIAQRIRSSLDLKGILSTAVAEVRQFLQTDRVVIYRCDPDGSKVVTVESVCPEWEPMQDLKILDDSLSGSMFNADNIQVVEDIYKADLPPSYVDLLAEFQVRANLVMPIALQGLATEDWGNRGTLERGRRGDGKMGSSIAGSSGPKAPSVASHEATSQNREALRVTEQSQPWGMLVAHHCRGARHWQPQEMDLLKQLAAQLAIAISQAELYQKLQDANQELQRIATLDGLTLISNRRRFDEYFEWEWARSRHDRTPISLILCDVDFFKLFNDTYGHQAGDACLKKVAAALNRAVDRCLRRVGEWESGNLLEGERQFLAARYGGEEFAVILPNRDTTCALRAANAIRSEMESLKLPHAKSGIGKYVTLSMGIASTIPETEVFAELIFAADQALYRAKEQGRDRIVLS
ncbi:MAG TPA: PAS domain S-box protein [Kamptonema sp.]|nr:PAS domain S-box protein [Kamptonema sp.]